MMMMLDLMIMVRLFCEALPEMERRSFLRIRARVPGTITCIHDAALSPSSSSSLSTHNGGEPQEMISLQRKRNNTLVGGSLALYVEVGSSRPPSVVFFDISYCLQRLISEHLLARMMTYAAT